MAKNENAAAVFSKQQLVESRKYANRRDPLKALLEDGKTYTIAEVDAAIEKFMKGKVR